MPFFIIFIMIPVTEIFVFMLVGEQVGLLNTLLLALCTAIIGGAVVRKQGLETIFQAQSDLRQGQIPVDALFEGLCLIAAGAMLITPGFVTDTLGFLLLIRPLRKAAQIFIKTRMMPQNHPHQSADRARQYGGRLHDPNAIDGEYERMGDE